MALTFSPAKAQIFRITHIDNMPWILREGLHCASAASRDPGFTQIGNPDLIARRAQREVPIQPGGSLADYVPFYFTPFTPMLLNIKTGYNGIRQVPMDDIVILVTSLHQLASASIPFIFSDRHAYLKTARYFSALDDLSQIDWEPINQRDFRKDPENPVKSERYQAEALIHRHLPLSALRGIVCASEHRKAQLDQMAASAGVPLSTAARPSWYF
jgi:hypothetical protein